MEVVYLFFESVAVRIPFYDYDRRLFTLLSARGDGVWDNVRHEFIFKRNENSENLSRIFPGASIPCVQVEEDTPGLFRIFGFFERSWEKPVTLPPVKRDENRVRLSDNSGISVEFSGPLKSNFTMLGPLPPPEIFPEHWRIKLEAELRARKYSPRTLSTYLYYNRLFCRTLQKIPEKIQPEDITKFLAFMEKEREYSASSINLAISAIKFFYGNILKNESISEQQRPRNDKRLPMVLSKTEISAILSMEKNPKHRLLLMLVYSSGLRVSEVVALKREHIDLARKVIYIRLGKGRKDRCTLLSEKAARFITEYCAFYGIKTWLFPGQPATRPLTIRSAQQIFDKAVRRAEIPKKISIHCLRHTFATHLLESGTDIRYIQTLLGHANLRTTERYTHVARRSVLRIQSPPRCLILKCYRK